METIHEGEAKIALIIMGIWTEGKVRGRMGEREEERNCWIRCMGIPRLVTGGGIKGGYMGGCRKGFL